MAFSVKTIILDSRNSCRPSHIWMSIRKMAGAAGFEPTHGRIKTCCLTAWRRPCICCCECPALSFQLAGNRDAASLRYKPCKGLCKNGRQFINFRFAWEGRCKNIFVLKQMLTLDPGGFHGSCFRYIEAAGLADAIDQRYVQRRRAGTCNRWQPSRNAFRRSQACRRKRS